MAKLDRFKEFLDWVERAKLLFDVALAIAGAKGIKAVLVTFTKIPPVWDGLIEWIGAALILWGAMYAMKKWAARRDRGQWLSTASVALAKTEPPFDIKVFLSHIYKSDLQGDMEDKIGDAIKKLAPAERDVCVRQFIASGVIAYVYDQIWWSIYRSQLELLIHLNREVLRREVARLYYDRAVQAFPLQYKTYHFEGWLKYLFDKMLILELPGATIGITQRGKDFLKHMVHWGYSIDTKQL